MPHMLVLERVADYEKWRPIFEEHGVVRKSFGCKGTQVFRNSEDPNEIVLLVEWDNLANARRFTQSTGEAESLRKAGVDIHATYFLDDAGGTAQ